jgi:hypothetical protein
MKFSKEKEESIINDYLRGYNTVEIANKWNTYNTSIRRVLLRNNIKIRNNAEVHSNIQECPFRDNDEYSEYFLGLLLTDGCITRRTKNSATISLSLIDKELMEAFQNFICPTNKLGKVLQKKYNTYMYQSSTRSKLIADWLDSKGNFYNKSYECDIETVNDGSNEKFVSKAWFKCLEDMGLKDGDKLLFTVQPPPIGPKDMYVYRLEF